MKKITTHLWFDKEAVEATNFYTSIFKDSKIENHTVMKNTPSGDCDLLSFTLANQPFMAISAGPYFKINPSISLFVTFETEEEIEHIYKALIEGGEALMEYNTYPWAKKYVWLKDKFGLTWQLSYTSEFNPEQKITPLLMYTKDNAGKTKEALEFYTAVFPNSNIETIVPYTKEDGDVEGYTKHSRFTLNGQLFMAMDSSGPHEFVFNEAVSLLVPCETQEEIDYFWEKLSAVPESEQCGWLKDKFGVSWQIHSTELEHMLLNGNEEQVKRVTESFLKMKKFDIAELKKAYAGE